METAAAKPHASDALVRADAQHLLAALDRMHGRGYLSLNVVSAMEALRHTLGVAHDDADRWRGPL